MQKLSLEQVSDILYCLQNIQNTQKTLQLIFFLNLQVGLMHSLQYEMGVWFKVSSIRFLSLTPLYQAPVKEVMVSIVMHVF